MVTIPNRSHSLSPWSPDSMPNPGSSWPLVDRLLAGLGEAALPGRLPVDMVETDSHVIVDMALPGVSPENLDLQVEGRQLTIRGRYAARDLEGGRAWVRTLPSGDFQYSLTLPVNVEMTDVDAVLESGLLSLQLPKVAQARSRKIEIRQGDSQTLNAG